MQERSSAMVQANMVAILQSRSASIDIDQLRNDPAANAILASALSSRRFELYAPNLIGIWLDSLFLGLILILYAFWVLRVQATDARWTKVLVHITLATTAFSSVYFLAHLLHILGAHFGEYLAFFDVLCECLLLRWVYRLCCRLCIRGTRTSTGVFRWVP